MSSKTPVRMDSSASDMGHSKTFSVLPYLQLMRLDRPSGYWYFWYPHVFGTLLAGIQEGTSVFQLLYINLVLFWGVLIMRGATCTWNDTVDVDFDRQVSRCRERPIARGAVSVPQALAFTAFQSLLSLMTLMLLTEMCMIYAVPAVLGWFLYPLAKRVTHYPQVFLGFPMAWGVYMGAAAMGADPLHLSTLLDAIKSNLDSATFSASELLAALQEVRVDRVYLYLYLGNVFWTVLYELIYSHQDAPEDAAAGVKTLVLLYANPDAKNPADRYNTLRLLSRLAFCQISCLTAVGVSADFSYVYSILCVAGTTAALSTMLNHVRLEQPNSCVWWFRVGNIGYAGGAMLAGLLGEFLMATANKLV